jgi:hypothetical protein
MGKLYASFDNAHLAADSPNLGLRATLLRYVDDRREMYRLVAILARSPEPDTAVQAQITALKSDAMGQVAALQRLAAAKTGERH